MVREYMTTAEILQQLPEKLVQMYLAMRQQILLRKKGGGRMTEFKEDKFYRTIDDMCNAFEESQQEVGRLERENAQLKSQLTWRPVSEPPKENVGVEVCDMSKPSLDEREPVIAYYEKGKWICVFPYNYDVYAYITPTHWRYIPPAPEGE